MTRETEIHAVVGGHGPPVLLLHGYPQTHACWHRVAPALAALLALWAVRPSGRDRDLGAIWRDWANDVRGQGIVGGHFLPEEAPEETLAALEPFLAV